MKVELLIVMTDSPSELGMSSHDRLYVKDTEWSAVPPVGADVCIGEDGWNQTVKRIFWYDSSDKVDVELGKCHDSQGEGLEEDLVKYGWKHYGHGDRHDATTTGGQ